MLAFGLALKPTSTPSMQSGRNLLVGLRTWVRRRMMGIQRLQTPCANAFMWTECSICWWTQGWPRMTATPATRRGRALAPLCLMPEMASMSSTATSCCGMWHTCGIMGASLPSTAIAIGFAVWCKQSRVGLPWPFTQRKGSHRETASKRRNLKKFLNSTRWRRRISIFKTVWKCRRTLRLWFTLWMALQDVRLGMRRKGCHPPGQQVEL